ncbi:MAG: hypothetical protein AAFW67_12100 [Cyanobacteria bacterium J06638_38]
MCRACRENRVFDLLYNRRASSVNFSITILLVMLTNVIWSQVTSPYKGLVRMYDEAFLRSLLNGGSLRNMRSRIL